MNQFEPPEPPPWEPPEPPVVDYGYTHRRESVPEARLNQAVRRLEQPDPPEVQARAIAQRETQKGEIPWLQGVSIAWEVMALLDDLCSRITVGGSLRRSKPIVGDIEVIAQPIDPAKFARRCDLLLDRGRFTHRLSKAGYRIAWSNRYRAVWFLGLPLDLFIVQPDRQWGPTYLIHTGPGEANETLVTAKGILNRNGHRGVLPHNVKFDDGLIWRDDEPFDCPEEKHVFAACGLPWVSPWLRSSAYYHRAEALVQATLRESGVKPLVGQPLDWNDDGPRKEWGWARSPLGKWHRLEAAELLRRRPDLAAEIESLKIAGEVVEQVGMF